MRNLRLYFWLFAWHLIEKYIDFRWWIFRVQWENLPHGFPFSTPQPPGCRLAWSLQDYAARRTVGLPAYLSPPSDLTDDD